MFYSVEDMSTEHMKEEQFFDHLSGNHDGLFIESNPFNILKKQIEVSINTKSASCIKFFGIIKSPKQI